MKLHIITVLLCSLHLAHAQTPKQAIIIGASSGIGSSLATALAKHGYQVGMMSRRLERLEALQKSLPTKSYIRQVDVRDTATAQQELQSLLATMGDVELIIINAGVGHEDRARDWHVQKEMLETNVLGFAAVAHTALAYFIKRGRGHLVGITSPAGLRGLPFAYTYGATKAFDALLLEGIRNTMRAQHLPIEVTDIKPGFVDTDMVRNNKHKFWVATSDEAAEQIYDAIVARSTTAYVTKRWAVVGWILRNAPDWVFRLALHFAKN